MNIRFSPLTSAIRSSDCLSPSTPNHNNFPLCSLCILRSSSQQLFHWSGWFAATSAGQWYGGVPTHRAPPSGWHGQPHSQQKERYPGHWQWPEPGGVEAEEGAGPWPGHCLWTQIKGKHAALLKVTRAYTHLQRITRWLLENGWGWGQFLSLRMALNSSYHMIMIALIVQFSLDWNTSAFFSVSLRCKLTDSRPVQWNFVKRLHSDQHLCIFNVFLQMTLNFRPRSAIRVVQNAR